MSDLEDKIKEAAEEGSLEETLEEIVDRRVEKKLHEKQQSGKERKTSEEDMSRRSFLKKAGLGAVGLGAMSMLPSVSALEIRDSEGFQAYSGDTEYLDVNPGGPVEVKNAELRTEDIRTVIDGHSQTYDTLGASGSLTSQIWSHGGDFKFYDRFDGENEVYRFIDGVNSNDLLRLNVGGPIEVQNADFTVKDLTIGESGAGEKLGTMDYGITSSAISFYRNADNGDQLIIERSVGSGEVLIGNSQNVSIHTKGDNDVEIPNGNLNVGGNSVTTNSFEVTENSSTNSLDFNYTG